MMAQIRGGLTMVFVLGILMIPLSPRPAAGQCVGASAIEDFAPNMKGCAGTVSFASRASLCAPGWHVCSATEWVARFGGKVPTYNYWTNDNLGYSADANGCSVSTSTGYVCTAGTPMRVCTAFPWEHDGAFSGPSRLYLLQTFLDDSSITLATSIHLATFATQIYVGSFSGEVFTGGPLTLTFTGNRSGTDGTNTFTQLVPASATLWAIPDINFTSVVDPLGNFCNWHRCGLEVSEPVKYFGGCEGNTTAGVLCCQ